MSNAQPEPGHAIFQDVFRRADKNDDNCLDRDEFQQFFKDGVLSSTDLDELFDVVDADKSKNIDVSELCSYFTKHFQAFRDIYASLEHMNHAIQRSLVETAKTYGESGHFEQFCTRFLLKEVLSQLECLQNPVDVTVDKLEEIALSQRPYVSAALTKTIASVDASTPGTGNTVVSADNGSSSKRRQRSYNTQTSIPSGNVVSGGSLGGGALSSEIDRLASLVSRLDGHLVLAPLEEEHTDASTGAHNVLVITRNFKVTSESNGAFRESLRTYLAQSRRHDAGLVHAAVRSFTNDPSRFSLIEVWQSHALYEDHCASKHSKQFRKDNIDNLATAEQLKESELPASWFPQEDCVWSVLQIFK